MSATRAIYNVYCDESCHLENDKQKSMVLGAVWCPRDASQRVAHSIRTLKRAHGLKPDFEIKWTKVSPAKIGFYSELVELFFNDPDLRFRALIVPDKSALNHHAFDQTHDDFYYKMYYLMLRHIVTPTAKFHIYLDIKDTRGAKKVVKLHEVLRNSFYDFEGEVIERVQQIRSHESELLQMADLLIGAVSYSNRGLSSSSAKGQLIDLVRKWPGVGSLEQTSSYGRTKFNLFHWHPQGV